ncbi:DUF4302 domain-containing protein [Plebeiibacterium sediminum]|uniref:DUF4302 domain-containing protein n=1 Tax=Plebeiibacterium sediminum TaxID=2992112 RepID=A0AAE3M467_9BACT|nr:DUF4302 domain-containing protein [Plebeiobacterium sediminum]MCW3786794.1 DUF4302 domain-containing protein [Plebeiobacterium sediminum]
MKNIIYLILFSIVLVFAVSCDNDSEEIFDQTASERKTAAVEEYLGILQDSEFGWSFQYFPEKELSYGGYNFVVKFGEDRKASVWTELAVDISQSVESYYDVISYGGPVLTFNTYNNFMHYFATPSADEYDAKGGDYEFRLISYENGVVTLKGTKTGNEMRLIKLEQPVENYLNDITDMVSRISGVTLAVNVDGVYAATQNTARNIVFDLQDIDSENGNSYKIPYIISAEGIHFYEPIDIAGIMYQDFVYNSENNILESSVGNVFFDIVVPPINLNSTVWYLDVSVEANRSSEIFNSWVSAYNANANTWGEELYTVITLGEVSAVYGDYGISFYSYPGPYRAHYNMNFVGVPGHSDYLDFIKIDGGFNWTWYTHLEVFINEIADNAPYITEIDNDEDPSEVKFTSVSNPDVWFIIKTTY